MAAALQARCAALLLELDGDAGLRAAMVMATQVGKQVHARGLSKRREFRPLVEWIVDVLEASMQARRGDEGQRGRLREALERVVNA